MNGENDYKVVTLKNISDFEFTPVLGAMFDGRPIFGKNGKSIEVGEEILTPYHVGKRLATNLAKAMLLKGHDVQEYGKGDPSVSLALFNDENVENLAQSMFVNQYQEEKPIAETEVDILMRKFEELNKTIETLTAEKVDSSGYKDKQEVIDELDKRGIQHDKRQSKASLEELLK